jgi:hypothetical protein
MWTAEIFINALSDALVQRTCPALYDQLDVVTMVTDQRLKAETTAAIHEWAASAVSCMCTLPVIGAHSNWIVRILLTVWIRKTNPKIPL